jgi:L-ribulose-5-phosphate 3-epimerase
MKTNRRHFLYASALTGATMATNLFAHSGNEGVNGESCDDVIQTPQVSGAGKLSIFSKNLHWLDYQQMASVVADLGFDGIDLTVRPAGHVLPERVTTDLPKAVEAIRKAGLSVFMITTAIDDATAPYAEAILKTASSLGIGQYRTGWFKYNGKQDINAYLSDAASKLKDLAALSAKHKIIAAYQNHSGEYFGAPIWDLQAALRQINSPWLRSQYDVMHATVEGANAWPMGLELIKPNISSVDIKDFVWEKKNGKWSTQVVPLGEGMVDFKRFFSIVAQDGWKVPLSVHYEYPLGGVENGATTLTMKREDVLQAMKADCVKLRGMLT